MSKLRAPLLAILVVTILNGGYYARLRWVTTNFHTVVNTEVYRSAQPSPDQIQSWAKQYKLATIINLRDDAGAEATAQELHAAQQAMLQLKHHPIADRSRPKRLDLLAIVETLETAPRPILLHCRAGADRAGTISVLAAMAIGGASYKEARGQLSMQTLHFGDHPDHVESVLFDYENYCKRNKLDLGDWSQFKSWLMAHYSHAYYLVEIATPGPIEALAETICEPTISITNLSSRSIPAADLTKQFTIATYMGTSTDLVPDREFGPRTQLPREDIAPGATVELNLAFWPPDEPGEYTIHIDIVEEDTAWFANQGSPEPSFRLIVRAP